MFAQISFLTFLFVSVCKSTTWYANYYFYNDGWSYEDATYIIGVNSTLYTNDIVEVRIYPTYRTCYDPKFWIDVAPTDLDSESVSSIYIDSSYASGSCSPGASSCYPSYPCVSGHKDYSWFSTYTGIIVRFNIDGTVNTGIGCSTYSFVASVTIRCYACSYCDSYDTTTTYWPTSGGGGSSSSSSSSNTGAIVGGVIGGLVVLSIIGVIIYYACVKEKTNKDKQSNAEANPQNQENQQLTQPETTNIAQPSNIVQVEQPKEPPTLTIFNPNVNMYVQPMPGRQPIGQQPQQPMQFQPQMNMQPQMGMRQPFNQQNQQNQPMYQPPNPTPNMYASTTNTNTNNNNTSGPTLPAYSEVANMQFQR